MIRCTFAAAALAVVSTANADLVIDSALGTTLDVSHSVGSGDGENLAWGHAGIGKAITDWYNEIGLYNFNRPGL